MPRFRGRVGRRAPARRTEWIGSPNVAFDSVADGSTANITLLDMETLPAMSPRMTHPTLIRIRGQIGVDSALAANQTTDPRNGVVGLIIYKAEAAISTLSNAESAGAANFSNDNILWTGLHGISSEWANFNVGSNLTEYRIGGFYPHSILQVDVKAMRKLEDRDKIFLQVVSYAGSGSQLLNSSNAYYYLLRFLLKE